MAVNQEIKILFTVDDSQLEGAKKSTVDLGNAAKADIDVYKKLGDTINKSVSGELKAANVTVKEYTEAMKKAAESGGQSVQQLQKLGETLLQLGSKFESLAKNIDQNKNKLIELKQQALEASNNVKKIAEEAGKGSDKYIVAKKAFDDINNQIKQTTLSQAKLNQELSQTKNAIADSKGQFNDLKKGIENSVPPAKSLRAELAAAKQAAVDAAAKFGESSVEFRNAASRAGELKAQLGDLNQTLDALDPDAKAKAFNQVGQAAFGAFQVATGALQAFGVENEKVNKIAQQFQGLLNISQGLSQLGQLGDSLKNVATVLGITTQAQKAATVATAGTTVALEGEAVATTAASTATKGLTASLLASPFVIIAAAVAALAGAVYLYNKENEDAIALQEELKKQQEDLLRLNQQLTEAYIRGANKAADDVQFQIDLASAQGKGQAELIALEIDKQKQLQKGFQFALDQNTADVKQTRELTELKNQANQQQQIAEAKLTTFLREEGKKRGEQAKEAAKKAKAEAERLQKEATAARIAAEKAEQDRLSDLRRQFETELSTQTKAINDDLALKRIINAERYFGKEKELKLADIVAEEQSIQAKIELNKVFGLDTTTEQQKLYAQLALLRKEYDATNAAGNKTALQSFLADNQKIIEAALEAYSALSNAFLDITSAQTEAQIESLNAQFDADREGTQQLLDDKRISQKEYDDSIAALEKKRDLEIKKLQREQAIREKSLGIFSATIQTALAILTILAQPGVDYFVKLAQAIAAGVQGASQIAIIAAAPIPKFAKGTLNVGGGHEGTDSVHAMLMPGEAVIPTRVNRKYKEPIKAIFHESVGADELTQFIQMTPNMRYALLMAAGEQFNESIVNKPTNISTAQIMNSYITQSVRGSSRSSGSGRAASVNVDMSGVERSIRNNKTVKLDNTKQLAQQIAASITDTMNIRRKW